jgi:hypothetical protein
VSLLDDPQYAEAIRSNYLIWKRNILTLENPVDRWEYLKYKIREFTIQFSKENTRKFRADLRDLEQQVKMLERKLGTDASIGDRYIECKGKLNRMYDKITDGIIIRSRTQWHEEGEKSTKYFLNMEKKQKYKSHVRKLLINGVENTDSNEILNEIKLHYSSIYKRKSSVTEDECRTYLQNVNIPTLSIEESASLGEPIKLAEIHKALKSMSNSKSPGNDGLPKEFLLGFFDLMGHDLLDSFNTSFNTGSLGTSQNQAVVTLIEKNGKDNRLLTGWRPISLMNTDTKIISKILVARIKHLLPALINADQFAFVPQRFIGEANRLISDVVQYTKIQNTEGILFAADFAAAFDSLDFTFLFMVLESFGFPESFIRWVKILYSHSESCVMNFGRSTGYFKLYRGARQGDPLAPYLFLFAIEILAAKVRNTEHIHGININNQVIKQCLFADDASYFLKDAQSLKHLLDIIEDFSRYSSLKLHKSKSEAAWIGSRRHSTDHIGEFSWVDLTKNSIKILGIHYTYNEELSDKLNFDRVVSKFSNVLNLWKQRQLTIYGRKEIVQTLGLSQIYYVSNILDPPTKNIQRIKELITDFVWNGRRPKVKYKCLIDEYNNGGIKLPDFEAKVKTQRIIWIKKLLEDDFGKWKLIPYYYLNKIVGNNVTSIRTNFDISCLPNAIPTFYKYAFNIWSNFATCIPTTPQEVLIQPLWRNTYIRVNNQTIYYRNLNELGICSMKQLLNWDGFLKHPKDILSVEQYDKCVMPLNSLLKSIPKEWLRIINNATSREQIQKYTFNRFICVGSHKIVEFEKLISKQIYAILLQTICNVPTARLKFENVFEGVDWCNLCSSIYKTSIDTYSREFQFKVMHNYLNVNDNLYKWKLVETRLCSFCFMEPETVTHLFCECFVIRNFYYQIVEWAKSLNVNLPNYSESENWYLINCVLK